MPDAAVDLISHWLALIDQGESGAALWHNTPAPLVAALARHAAAHQGPPRPVEPGIFALAGGLLVGVMARDGAFRLVSPQAVLRDRLAVNWTRIKVGPMLYLLGRGVAVEGIAAQAERVMTRIRSRLDVPLPPFRYYVPGATDFATFAQIEARLGHRAALAGWGWTDPFGGDVVSRDPVDAHELTHALANSLDGWPPAVLREGLAECFTRPLDWRDWTRHSSPLSSAELWTGSPGQPPGWYAAAAILATTLRRGLGLEGFKGLWRDLAATADHGAVLTRCGWNAAELTRAYGAVGDEVRHQGYFARSFGLAALW